MQHAHATPEAAVRDESKSVDAAKTSRGDTKTPLEMSIVDSPGLMQHTHDTSHVPVVPCIPSAMLQPRSQIHCVRSTHRLYTVQRLMIILIRRYAMMELWIVIPQRIIIKV